MILVTGGAGFIGANFVLDWLDETGEPLVNLDKLTYAGNLGSLASLRGDARHVFVRGDIGDRAQRRRAARAASAARDRQFRGRDARRPVDPRAGGVHRHQRRRHVQAARSGARLLVGAAGGRARARSASCTFRPTRSTARSGRTILRSRRRRRTRRTARTRRRRPRPTIWCAPIITRTGCRRSRPTARTTTDRCQFPEKLIPLMIVNAHRRQAVAGLRRRPQRSRLALRRRSLRGDPRGARAEDVPGATYNVGGNAEMTNLDVVRHDLPHPGRARAGPRLREPRDVRQGPPGHDRRYAIDAAKIRRELGVDARANRSTAECARPCAGISTTARGSPR